MIIFQNMVGPGEVDEDLEPETFEECGKYGKVIKCLIFEVRCSIIIKLMFKTINSKCWIGLHF